MDDTSLATVALTNRLLDVGAAPLKASEFWRLTGEISNPASLLGASLEQTSEMTAGLGLDPERLTRLLDIGIGLAGRLNELLERGISAVSCFDERYPARLLERLTTAAPPVLYCAGAIDLLGRDGIGIVGSRDVGRDAADVTHDTARQVAASGVPLVSGGAKGVDSIGMAGAYAAGGAVVGILADSLIRAVGRSDNRTPMLEGLACLCTPYNPGARFTTGTAMGRNKIIYGLSRATLVVTSAHGKGGTWSGATEALKKRYGTVGVWTGPGAGPGNAALIEQGATGIDDVTAVLDLEAVPNRLVVTDKQMALDFTRPTDEH